MQYASYNLGRNWYWENYIDLIHVNDTKLLILHAERSCRTHILKY